MHRFAYITTAIVFGIGGLSFGGESRIVDDPDPINLSTVDCVLSLTIEDGDPVKLTVQCWPADLPAGIIDTADPINPFQIIETSDPIGSMRLVETDDPWHGFAVEAFNLHE